MSETIARRHGGGSLSGERRRAWSAAAVLSPVGIAITVATVLALALRLYQFTRPGYLFGVTEYDDGNYFGSAVRLVNGGLPYKDFIFVQPPGIMLLMTPAALLGKVAGTAHAMAIGRLLTAVASAAGVALAGLLARHRGVLAVTIACGFLAVYPDSIDASHTVMVEPWLTLLCLLGALVVFDGDRLAASGRRLLWGGAVFGLAGATEVWAIIPVLVVLALCLRSIRRAALFAAGVAGAFLVVVLPFALTAPYGFYQSLYVAQLAPRVVPQPRRPGIYRVENMLGLVHVHLYGGHTAELLAWALGVLVVSCLVAGALLTRSLPATLDWFVLATCVLIIVMFSVPNQFWYHFPAFLGPFLTLAVALPLARVITALSPAGSRQWLPWLATAAAGILVAGLAVIQQQAEAKLAPSISAAQIAKVSQAIPAGACVVSDQSAFLLLANRLVSDQPGCPLLLDGVGTNLAFSHGRNALHGAGNVPAVAAIWRNQFEHAQYAWLSPHNTGRIGWNAALHAYLNAHFARVMHTPVGSLYQRKGMG